MRQSAKSLLVLALCAAVVMVLVWTILGDRTSQPYTVQRSSLSGWTVVASQGAEPWVIAARPPAALSASLFQQLAASTREPLAVPDGAALPLVTRTEYDDALQGVYGVDSLLRMARDVGIESSEFEPVCVARKAGRSGGELFYVAFSSPAFRELREGMVPPQPEHGGIGVYDPAALIPLLPVAARGGEQAQWWPLAFDRRTDCQAPLFVD